MKPPTDPKALALSQFADVVLDALWERLTTAQAQLLGLAVPGITDEPEVIAERAEQARAALVAILTALGRHDEAHLVATQTGPEQ